MGNSRDGSGIHCLEECATSPDISEVTKLLNIGANTHVFYFLEQAFLSFIFNPCWYYKVNYKGKHGARRILEE